MDWSQTAFGRRVTIVGDAAHCMPPHRGQGLNNALQDSATLVEELVAVQKGEKDAGRRSGGVREGDEGAQSAGTSHLDALSGLRS